MTLLAACMFSSAVMVDGMSEAMSVMQTRGRHALAEGTGSVRELLAKTTASVRANLVDTVEKFHNKDEPSQMPGDLDAGDGSEFASLAEALNALVPVVNSSLEFAKNEATTPFCDAEQWMWAGLNDTQRDSTYLATDATATQICDLTDIKTRECDLTLTKFGSVETDVARLANCGTTVDDSLCTQANAVTLRGLVDDWHLQIGACQVATDNLVNATADLSDCAVAKTAVEVSWCHDRDTNSKICADYNVRIQEAETHLTEVNSAIEMLTALKLALDCLVKDAADGHLDGQENCTDIIFQAEQNTGDHHVDIPVPETASCNDKCTWLGMGSHGLPEPHCPLYPVILPVEPVAPPTKR